jgi:hypothetical protein
MVVRYLLFDFCVTVSGLAKVATFTTNVDAENQTLINHKCACGALNRHFCQTRVTGSCFFYVVFVRCHFVSVLVRWLGGSFAKLGFSLGLCGFANVPPKAWAILLRIYSLFFLVSHSGQMKQSISIFLNHRVRLLLCTIHPSRLVWFCSVRCLVLLFQ